MTNELPIKCPICKKEFKVLYQVIDKGKLVRMCRECYKRKFGGVDNV